jgi:hypothetical protein
MLPLAAVTQTFLRVQVVPWQLQPTIFLRVQAVTWQLLPPTFLRVKVVSAAIPDISKCAGCTWQLLPPIS